MTGVIVEEDLGPAVRRYVSRSEPTDTILTFFTNSVGTRTMTVTEIVTVIGTAEETDR